MCSIVRRFKTSRTPARYASGALIGGVVLLAAASCANAAPTGNSDPGTAGRVARACSATMGLSSGTLDYADCVASLSASAAGMAANRTLTASRATCATAGPEGTPAFALCVLDHEQARR
jgi:hypothetical protein